MSIVNEQIPGVRVVRGTPDDLELVALVAGLASTTVSLDEEPVVTPPVWGRDRGIRNAQPFGTSDDGWRWSSRP